MITKDDKVFNIDHQWSLYLERVGLKGKKINPNAYREMKQAFFGAFGQSILLLRDEVAALPEEDGMEVLDGLINQVGNYFHKASGRMN